jgi:hypothetical protein
MFRRAVASCLLLIAAAAASAQAPAPNADAGIKRVLHVRLPVNDVKPIPFETVKGAIILPAVIEGRPVNILFDNGSVTMVDDVIARQFGTNLKETGVRLDTGLSKMRTRLTEGSMVIGETLTVEGQLIVADLAPMSRALGVPIAAVLGADAMTASVIVVNPDRKWIAFGLPGHIKTNSKFKANAQQEAKAGLPATIAFGPDFIVNATIDGQPVRLRIDYGHTGTVTLRTDVWERVLPAGARTGKVATSLRADGLRTYGQIGVAELRFGSVKADKVEIVGQNVAYSKWDGLLGLGVLGKSTTILQMPKRTLWVFPANQDVTVEAVDAGEKARAAAGTP